MPEIRAFRGWRYNGAKIRRLDRVVAPPYDVISKKEQQRLYRLDPHNVIRLELGRDEKGDTASHNKYTRAAAYLEDWKNSGALFQDPVPCLYVYVQDYREEGKKKTRTGFLAAMKVDERAVLKHENTLAGPKKDRLSLLKEVRTNLSPIFGLFEDRQGTLQSLLKKSAAGRPEVDITIDRVRHRLFAESRPAVISAVCGAMRPKPMFIADGHHRFEVSCQFRDWMEGRDRGRRGAGWEYVMTYFSDCLHNPFKIFPTHRLLKVKNAASVLQKLRGLGRLEKMKGLAAVLSKLSATRRESSDKRYAFGVYTRKDGFHLLTLDKPHIGRSPVDSLDVAVLHRRIIGPRFGIRSIEKSAEIDFTRNAAEAFRKVRSGEFDAAIFLRPTSLSEMLVVSKKGLKMPQKSTYFYPKLLSGLVFHGLDES